MDVYTLLFFFFIFSSLILLIVPHHSSLGYPSCLILRICCRTPGWFQCSDSSLYISWQSEYGLIWKRLITSCQTFRQPDPCLSHQIHLIQPSPNSLYPSQTYLLSDSGTHYAASQLMAFYMLFPLPRMVWYSCPSALHFLASLRLPFPDIGSKNPSSETPSLVF